MNKTVDKGDVNSSNEDKINQIIGLLKDLKLQDFPRLEDALREHFGLEDLGSMAMSGGSGTDSSEESNDKSTVSLFIDDLGSLTRIESMKLLNQALKMSVSEVKEALDSLPFKVLENVTKEQAQTKIGEINAVKEGLVLSVR